MHIRTMTALTATAMLVAGCAAGRSTPRTPPGEQRAYNDGRTLDEALAGYTPGKPETCLPPGRSSPSSAYGTTVVYRISGNLLYRNDVGPGCEGLGRGDILVSATSQSRFCRGDIIRTVDPVARITTGGCAFNDFVPYRRNR